MKCMRLVIAVLALGLTASTAGADVKPPTGWESNPEFAAALSPRNDLFGGLPATATTEVYRAPIRGAVLYVTRVEAKVTAAQRDAAASYEVEELRRALERAGASAKPQSQSQRVDPAAKLVEGTLAWRDDTTQIVSSRRVTIAADANHIVAMLGECVLATDLAPEIGRACEQALQTIAPDIAPARRVALAIVAPTAAEPTAPTTPTAPTAPTGTPPATGSNGGPSMGDASHLPPMAPIQVATPKASKRDSDRRPVLLGLGLVVLAIAFYWNRRRREKFEREDARASASPGEPARRRDVDADDLHAAADAAPVDGDDGDRKKGDDDTTN